jgi:hypothetical protein
MSFARDILPWILGAAGIGLTGGALGIGPLAGMMGAGASGAGALGAAGAGLGTAAGGAANALGVAAVPGGIVNAAAAPSLGAKIASGIGGVLSNPAKFAMLNMGLAGVGSLADNLTSKKEKKKKSDTRERTMSRTMTPAPEGYQHGFEDEWRYFSDPQYNVKRFAQGGPVVNQAPVQSNASSMRAWAGQRPTMPEGGWNGGRQEAMQTWRDARPQLSLDSGQGNAWGREFHQSTGMHPGEDIDAFHQFRGRIPGGLENNPQLRPIIDAFRTSMSDWRDARPDRPVRPEGGWDGNRREVMQPFRDAMSQWRDARPEGIRQLLQGKGGAVPGPQSPVPTPQGPQGGMPPQSHFMNRNVVPGQLRRMNLPQAFAGGGFVEKASMFSPALALASGNMDQLLGVTSPLAMLSALDEKRKKKQQQQEQSFAEGGPVWGANQVSGGPQFDPMQSGLEATLGGARSSIRQNDKKLVKDAIAALMGKSPDEETAIGNFTARFGREALSDLVQKVRGELMQMGEQNRLVSGPGDGTSDSIPAVIDEQIPAKLSHGEYVVKANDVASLGQGDPVTGAKELEQLIRRAKGGV